MKSSWSLILIMVFTGPLLFSCSNNSPTEPSQPKAPTVATAAVNSITETTAASGGTVTSDGGAAITARGVCWSTNATPTIGDNTTADGSGSGSFSSSLTGLTAGTPYYVRAYATNSVGTGYGTVQSFTTTAPSYLSLSSSFDTDAENWNVSGGALYYRGAGGNPGGFVEFEDYEDQCGFFVAPGEFLGDITAYDRGSLSFDLKNTTDNGGVMLACYGIIRLTSGALYAETNIVPYDTFFSDWASFSIPMTADAWGLASAEWDSILTNVTEIRIYMDAQMAYYDRTGLDNFCLTSQDLNAGKGAQVYRHIRSR